MQRIVAASAIIGSFATTLGQRPYFDTKIRRHAAALTSQIRANCCERSLMALSGHHNRRRRCPLSGVKRKWFMKAEMSAFDPKRTCLGSPPLLAHFRGFLRSIDESLHRME